MNKTLVGVNFRTKKAMLANVKAQYGTHHWRINASGRFPLIRRKVSSHVKGFEGSRRYSQSARRGERLGSLSVLPGNRKAGYCLLKEYNFTS
jgi:hypothetical protein